MCPASNLGSCAKDQRLCIPVRWDGCNEVPRTGAPTILALSSSDGIRRLGQISRNGWEVLENWAGALMPFPRSARIRCGWAHDWSELTEVQIVRRLCRCGCPRTGRALDDRRSRRVPVGATIAGIGFACQPESTHSLGLAQVVRRRLENRLGSGIQPKFLAPLHAPVNHL